MTSMDAFSYQEMFPLGEDRTDYRRVSEDHVAMRSLGDRRILEVAPEGLELLAFTAARDMAHFLRPGHLEQLRRIVEDPEASDNDRFVAMALLKNACVAAREELPMCQDTGTAIVMGKKGQYVWTENDDAVPLTRGVARAYLEGNLRYSQLAALSMYEEVNTGNNTPVQVDISTAPGTEYEFLFIAKGGGSANKTFLYQQTPAVLRPEKLSAFLEEQIRTLGTAACPPYHLAIVIGGLSAEMTLKTVKLASCRVLDSLPTQGGPKGHAFRDPAMEEEILEFARGMGFGAQFGGKYFCHDVRVVRLPRHAISVPIGIAVSCSADRQAKAKITPEGIFLERLEREPEKYLPSIDESRLSGKVVDVDLSASMEDIRAELSRHPAGTRLSLTGPMIVARDRIHAEIARRLDEGGSMPSYFLEHPILYAAPAKAPKGRASGSLGPTTSQRMDAYIADFQARGASLVTIGKGPRSQEVVDSCARAGGFYLGTIGGAAAARAEYDIKKVDTVDFADLGMEAVRRIEVENFPAFIVIDDKGNNFYDLS